MLMMLMIRMMRMTLHDAGGWPGAVGRLSQRMLLMPAACWRGEVSAADAHDAGCQVQSLQMNLIWGCRCEA